MPDNKLDILKRLQDGEITAEEALKLMNQSPEPLEASASASPHQDPSHVNPGRIDPRQINPNKPHSPHIHSHHAHSAHPHHDPNHPAQNDPSYYDHHDFDHHHEPGWAEGMFGWVGDMIGGLSESLKDMDIAETISDAISGSFSHNERTVHFTSQPVLQSLPLLELHGKNDKIEIHAYDGNSVQIQCTYDSKHPDATVHFNDENGNVTLSFDEKIMRSVKVLCQVPRTEIDHLIAVTKNDGIIVGGITAKDIELATKNDKIAIEAVSCTNLSANTKNAAIRARSISATHIHFETTNDKVHAEDIHAQNLTMITTNDSIKTAAIDAEHIYMKTTNAGLKLEDTLICGSQLFWEGERVIEAYTTNGGIKFALPEGTGLSLEANTNGGKVNCDVPLYGAEGNKTYVKGESINFATSGRRLRTRLHTTNANIKIRG